MAIMQSLHVTSQTMSPVLSTIRCYTSQPGPPMLVCLFRGNARLLGQTRLASRLTTAPCDPSSRHLHRLSSVIASSAPNSTQKKHYHSLHRPSLLLSSLPSAHPIRPNPFTPNACYFFTDSDWRSAAAKNPNEATEVNEPPLKGTLH